MLIKVDTPAHPLLHPIPPTPSISLIVVEAVEGMVPVWNTMTTVWTRLRHCSLISFSSSSGSLGGCGVGELWLAERFRSLTGGVLRVLVTRVDTPWVLALEFFAVGWALLVERILLAIRWASRIPAPESFAVGGTLGVEGIPSTGTARVLADVFFTVSGAVKIKRMLLTRTPEILSCKNLAMSCYNYEQTIQTKIYILF